MSIADSLKDGSWITGWLSLVLFLVPIALSVYRENRTRTKLQNDISIYKSWSEEGDPAGLELCRKNINRRIKKLYSPKHVAVADVARFAFIGLVFVISTVMVKTEIEQGLEINLLWVANSIVYLVLAVIQGRKIWKMLQRSKGEQEMADHVVRMHADLMRLREDAFKSKEQADGDSDAANRLNDLLQRISRCFNDLYKVSEEVDGVDVDYLRDKEMYC